MKALTPGTSIHVETLVHDCCDVWQYQNLGARYIEEALGAQTLNELKLAPYPHSWQAQLAKGVLRWSDFNREAQAQLLQDVYRDGKREPLVTSIAGDFYIDDPIGGNVSFLVGKIDFTDFARESIA